jgi:hypothetical protein
MVIKRCLLRIELQQGLDVSQKGIFKNKWLQIQLLIVIKLKQKVWFEKA